MTVKVRCLLQAKYVEDTLTAQTLLNSAGTRALVDKVTVTNTDAGAQTFTAAIVKSGDTISAEDTLISAKSIAAGESYACPELVGQVLEPGDVLHLDASVASKLIVRITGREITV